MNEPRPPPGWYPDPAAPGAWRWWTGIEWSAHRGASGVAFHRNRALERTAARRTELAVLVRQLITAALVFAVPEQGESFHRTWTELRRLANGASTTQVTVADPNGWLIALGGLGVAVMWILLLVWQLRAGQVARTLGYRAHRSPGWGVATWFIPIVNLWMPAEALADLLPPGDLLRRTLWWCWAGYLAAFALNIVVFVLPAAHDIPSVAAYHALIAAEVALNLAVGSFLAVYVRGVETNHAKSFNEN